MTEDLSYVPVNVTYNIRLDGRATETKSAVVHLPIRVEELARDVTLQWRLSAKLEDQLTRQDGFTVHAEAADYPFTLSMSSKAAREAVFGQEPATAVVDLPVRSTKQEGKEFVRMPTADPRAP